MRRTPVQERSTARVQRMLDAAAELLDQHGGDAVTTSAVAQRAEVSVGSVYQFFPDRRAVLQALATRSFERFSERLADQLGSTPPRDWRAVVEVVVDTYVDFTRDEPGMQVLSFGGPVDRTMLDPALDNNAVVADRLGELLGSVVPGLRSTPELQLALRVAVEAADAVLELAFRHDPDGDPAVITQAKALLTSYLAEFL